MPPHLLAALQESVICSKSAEVASFQNLDISSLVRDQLCGSQPMEDIRRARVLFSPESAARRQEACQAIMRLLSFPISLLQAQGAHQHGTGSIVVLETEATMLELLESLASGVHAPFVLHLLTSAQAQSWMRSSAAVRAGEARADEMAKKQTANHQRLRHAGVQLLAVKTADLLPVTVGRHRTAQVDACMLQTILQALMLDHLQAIRINSFVNMDWEGLRLSSEDCGPAGVLWSRQE